MLPLRPGWESPTSPLSPRNPSSPGGPYKQK